MNFANHINIDEFSNKKSKPCIVWEVPIAYLDGVGFGWWATFKYVFDDHARSSTSLSRCLMKNSCRRLRKKKRESQTRKLIMSEKLRAFPMFSHVFFADFSMSRPRWSSSRPHRWGRSFRWRPPHHQPRSSHRKSLGSFLAAGNGVRRPLWARKAMAIHEGFHGKNPKKWWYPLVI